MKNFKGCYPVSHTNWTTLSQSEDIMEPSTEVHDSYLQTHSPYE